MSAISAAFPPEFLNRIDDIILYRSLSRKDIRKVVEVRLKEIQTRLEGNGRKIKLAVDDHAMDWLGSAGYSRKSHPLVLTSYTDRYAATYGARPLARLIQTEILNPLSKLLLQARVRDGETVHITADLRRNRLVVIPNQ